MGLLANLSIPAAELYLSRFCITETKQHVHVAHNRFRPLLEFVDFSWVSPALALPSTILPGRTKPIRKFTYVLVLSDHALVHVLTDAHFDLIQSNSRGFGQLFEWFPPKVKPSADEARILIRAGVNLNFAAHKIGVYIREYT